MRLGGVIEERMGRTLPLVGKKQRSIPVTRSASGEVTNEFLWQMRVNLLMQEMIRQEFGEGAAIYTGSTVRVKG